jgi:hypothetical protein
MVVILSIPDDGYFRNASCALNLRFRFLLTDHVMQHFI